MDYPVKTLSQLRPILKGFRKAAGFTQATMASHLGVTQQTYAQLEANPAAISVERLFRVLRVLNVDLMLTETAAGVPKTEVVEPTVSPAPASRPTRERKSESATHARKRRADVVSDTRRDGRKTGTVIKKRENW